MHRSVLVAILLGLGLVFAGCLTDPVQKEDPAPAEVPDPVDTGTPPPAAAPGDEVDPDDDDATTQFSAEIEEFTAFLEEGMNFTFTMRVATDDPDATWILEPGDGTEYTGLVAEMPESILHSYKEPGNYSAMLVVSVSAIEPVESELLLMVHAPLQMVYLFTDPVFGCAVVDYQLCISEQIGPEDGVTAIDGHWVKLDDRYWGLEFQVTNDGLVASTGCNAYDGDGEFIAPVFDEAAQTCIGALPEGTEWLFIASWLEPALSMELSFLAPS